MGPAAPPLTSANAMIFEYRDEIVISADHEIKASMKDKLYKNVCAFTKLGVLCCACDCPSGATTKSGKKLSKHMCVHCLPNLFHHTLFLFSGLAEHFLCELKTKWKPSDDHLVPPELRLELLNAIIKLMGAARCDVLCSLGTLTVSSLLNEFKTPTERSMRCPPAPKPHEVKSLRVMKSLSSPASQCKERVKPTPNKVIDLTDKSDVIDSLSTTANVTTVAVMPKDTTIIADSTKNNDTEVSRYRTWGRVNLGRRGLVLMRTSQGTRRCEGQENLVGQLEGQNLS